MIHKSIILSAILLYQWHTLSIHTFIYACTKWAPDTITLHLLQHHISPFHYRRGRGVNYEPHLNTEQKCIAVDPIEFPTRSSRCWSVVGPSTEETIVQCTSSKNMHRIEVLGCSGNSCSANKMINFSFRSRENPQLDHAWITWGLYTIHTHRYSTICIYFIKPCLCMYIYVITNPHAKTAGYYMYVVYGSNCFSLNNWTRPCRTLSGIYN